MPLLAKRSSIAVALENVNNTAQRETPHEITGITWGGAATAPTLTSALLTGATSWSYLGDLVEITEGNRRGEWAQIVSFDPATDTATLDRLSAVPTSGTTARLWVPPDPIVRSDFAEVDALHVTAANRTELTDFWVLPSRYYLLALSGPNAGQARLVTAFTAGPPPRFTVATGFGANPAAGELYVLRRPLLVAGDVSIEPAPTIIERDYVRGAFAREPVVVDGPRGGTASIALELKGAGQASAGPTAATRATEAGDLLRALLGETRDGSSLATAGGGITTVPISTGTHERFGGALVTDIGTMIMVGGEAAMITEKADGGGGSDVLTVTPPLGQAPVLGAGVFGGVNLEPLETGHFSHTIERHLGAEAREMIYGWQPNLLIEGLVPPELPRLRLTGPFDLYMHQDEARGYVLTFDAAVARPSRRSRVVLGTTTIRAVQLTFDLGMVFSPETAVSGSAAGRNGHFMGDRVTAGTLKLWMDDVTEVNRFERGAEVPLLVQVGNAQLAAFAIYCPAIQYQGAPIAVEAGGYIHDIPFRVLRSPTTGVADWTLTQF